MDNDNRPSFRISRDLAMSCVMLVNFEAYVGMLTVSGEFHLMPVNVNGDLETLVFKTFHEFREAIIVNESGHAKALQHDRKLPLSFLQQIQVRVR